MINFSVTLKKIQRYHNFIVLCLIIILPCTKYFFSVIDITVIAKNIFMLIHRIHIKYKHSAVIHIFTDFFKSLLNIFR